MIKILVNVNKENSLFDGKFVFGVTKSIVLVNLLHDVV